jgi:hypothetical protein
LLSRSRPVASLALPRESLLLGGQPGPEDGAQGTEAEPQVTKRSGVVRGGLQPQIQLQQPCNDAASDPQQTWLRQAGAAGGNGIGEGGSAW